MRTILVLATMGVIGVAGAAYAMDRAQDKATGPAISTEQMKAQIDKLGYDVRHMKQDDGAYKTHLVDRDTGGNVDARFDSRTGELVRAKLARSEREAEERDDARGDRKAGKQEAGTHEERDDRDENRRDRD